MINKTIEEIISSSEIKGIMDYFKVYKKLNQEIESGKVTGEKTIKIAILSSFTITGIKETLFVKCCEIGVAPSIYVGAYNQYTQEILSEDSALYEFDPDLTIIFIDARALFGDHYLIPYQISDSERKDLVEEKFEEISTLIEKLKENSPSKILLHNFEVPLHSPLGILENKQEFGFIESVETLNKKIKDSFKIDPQVFILDYDSFCSRIGKDNVLDHKMYYLGDMKLDLQRIPDLSNDYLAYIKPMISATRKCIVLDLDNTLWGGVIGEDGLEGIKLGPTPQGRPFLEFQKYLLSLFNRGVILAINSKNNADDALSVFREHPHAVLKERHFASMHINWNDKISNMKAIAEELNIGLDSIVFIDDDKLNREMLQKALPDVHVVDLPDDSSLYLKTLMEISDFNTLQITEEDKKKGRMYAEQRKRHTVKRGATDITEYLKALEMVMTVETANSFNIPRISQLTQKTNQFNMTTRRYQEEDITKFAEDDSFLVVSVKVGDKYGDNGIVGAAIVEKKLEAWRIDTFLLSCRVLGRKIEENMLAYILDMARKDNVKKVIGEFIHTKKNVPAKDFFSKNSFRLSDSINDIELWEYDVSRGYPYIEFIKTIKET